MKYMGGKVRISKWLAGHINEHTSRGLPYWEPFVGGAAVVPRVQACRRIASDASKPLITTYKNLQNGWTPPTILTEERYAELKAKQDPDDPETAFAGFFCSFSGKWFAGYARSRGGERDFCGEAHRGLLKLKPLIEDVEFYHCSYVSNSPSGFVLYCDPPYVNTTGYGCVGGFDHSEFWTWTRRMAAADNVVLVSEYEAPDFAVPVGEVQRNLEMRRSKTGPSEKRTERLFLVNG